MFQAEFKANYIYGYKVHQTPAGTVDALEDDIFSLLLTVLKVILQVYGLHMRMIENCLQSLILMPFK